MSDEPTQTIGNIGGAQQPKPAAIRPPARKKAPSAPLDPDSINRFLGASVPIEQATLEGALSTAEECGAAYLVGSDPIELKGVMLTTKEYIKLLK